jgi:hypothetical protein
MSNSPLTTGGETPVTKAESLFAAFVQGAGQNSRKGLLKEEKHRHIYSFESYLRAIGFNEELVVIYCQQAQAANIITKVPRTRRGAIIDWRTGKFIGLLIGRVMAAAVLLFPIIAFFLWLFRVNLWSWKAFMYWELGSAVLTLLLLFLEAWNNSRAAHRIKPVVVIYFDGDPVKNNGE